MALNAKQQAFVSAYLTSFNATEAALRAGYSEKSAHAIGWENLRKPEIADEISARLSATAMSAEEVLRRLAEQARSDLGDFLDDDGSFDLDKARQAQKTGLIKKFKTKRTVRTIGEQEIESTEVEFELYDAQAALVHLGRHHKLFVDKQELTGKDGGPMQTEQLTKPDLSKLTVDELRQLRQMVAKATDDTAND